MMFLSQSDLAEDGLRLFLSNDLGQPQDAASVEWTVYSASGAAVSGQNLRAVRRSVGQYYAPWRSDVPSGSYRIAWSVQETMLSPVSRATFPFFVVDPGDYRNGPCFPLGRSPAPGGRAFIVGAVLGPGDLRLTLRDEDRFLRDAYAVFWYVRDRCGRAAVQRAVAAHHSVGEYYVLWTVALPTGAYEVVWEYQQYSDSPLQSVSQGFTVLGAAAPFTIFAGPEGENPVIFEVDWGHGAVELLEALPDSLPAGVLVDRNGIPLVDRDGSFLIG